MVLKLIFVESSDLRYSFLSSANENNSNLSKFANTVSNVHFIRLLLGDA